MKSTDSGSNLFLIDCQNDFVLKGAPLEVPGAINDMERIQFFIEKNSSKINKIYASLDSHHLLHIANPLFWVNDHGEHPKPFTIISASDVEKKKWLTTDIAYQTHALKYVEYLENAGKYVLCIWPPHCQIGTPGHNIVTSVRDAIKKWEENKIKDPYYSLKGMNILTEHYSAIKAEWIDPWDETTSFNYKFCVNLLLNTNKLYIAGEASSHCVASTVRDVVDYAEDHFFKDRIALLEDAMSPVPGFEKEHENFFKEMRDRNITITTTDKIT